MRFHDQHIDPLLRKNRALRNRLVIKVDVAGVEECSPFRAQQNAGRAKDVTGIDKLKRDAACLSGRRTRCPARLIAAESGTSARCRLRDSFPGA